MSEIPKEEGKRFNQGKTRLGLIPPFSIQEIGKVFTKGAEKYGDNNYRKGMPWSKCVDSLHRHLNAFEQGEDFDAESGLHHMAHVATNAIFLLEYYNIAPQYDDRMFKEKKNWRIGLDIDEVICDWVEPWCKEHNIEVPTSWYFQWNISELFKKWNETGELAEFYSELPPKAPASILPFEPICYISHRPVDVDITKTWLEKHGFPLKPVIHVTSREDKVKIALENKLDIFVDDSYETFCAMNKAGICCYLMDAKHNQRWNVGHRRIKSLTDLKFL